MKETAAPIARAVDAAMAERTGSAWFIHMQRELEEKQCVCTVAQGLESLPGQLYLPADSAQSSFHAT